MRRGSSLIVVGLGMWGSPGAAFADAPATESDPAAVLAARGHYQAAKVYFERSDYKRALNEFREAARDVDRPELDFNIGKTYEHLGDAARAVEYYERYLARSGDQPDRQEVIRQLAVLRHRVGRIVIRTQVAGSAFLLDEEPVPAASIGQPLAITEGRHRLIASKEGYLARTAPVTIVAEQTLEIALDPIAPVGVAPAVKAAPTRWWIAAVIAGAALLVGGATTIALLASGVGSAQPYRGNVSPGIFTINP